MVGTMKQWTSFLSMDECKISAPYGLVIAGDWLQVDPKLATDFDTREIGGWFSNPLVAAELHAITPEFFCGLRWDDGRCLGVVTSDDYADIVTVRQHISIPLSFESPVASTGADAIFADGGDVIFVTLYDSGQRQAIQRYPNTEGYLPLLWISDFRHYPEVVYDPAILKIDFTSTLFSGELDDYLEGRMDHEVYAERPDHKFEKVVVGRNWYRENETYFAEHPSAFLQWKAEQQKRSQGDL